MTDELEAYYSDDNPEPLVKFRELLHYLLFPVIICLLLVLYLEIFRNVGHTLHQKLVLAERAILLYFFAEVGLDFVLFEDKVEFLRQKWFDILLILPFLSMFRAAGRLGRVARGLRSLRLIRAGRIPVAAGLIVGETTEAARLLRISRMVKYVPKLQKALHLIRGLPSIVSYIPKAQSIVYITTETKRSASRAFQAVGAGTLTVLVGRVSESKTTSDIQSDESNETGPGLDSGDGSTVATDESTDDTTPDDDIREESETTETRR